MDIRELKRFPVQIKSVDLIELNSKKLNDKPISDESKKLDIQIKNWIEHISDKEVHTFLRITFTPRSEELGVFKLDIVYRGKCIAISQVSVDDLEQFAEIQSIGLLLPYLRQQITSILTQMGLPPYILPTIDVLSSIAILRENKE